jgi:hypothetical protein
MLITAKENSCTNILEHKSQVIDTEGQQNASVDNGRTAEIVDDRQEGMWENNVYTLHRVHRFARNAQGEYFLFISEGAGRPSFKHISQENAKIALGTKYVSPMPING